MGSMNSVEAEVAGKLMTRDRAKCTCDICSSVLELHETSVLPGGLEALPLCACPAPCLSHTCKLTHSVSVQADCKLLKCHPLLCLVTALWS